MPRIAKTVWCSAALSKRLFSFILDLFIVSVCMFPLLSLFSQSNLSFDAGSSDVSGQLLFVSVLVSSLFWAYFSVMEFYAGATIGMRVLGLRLGGDNTFVRCLIRHAYFLPVFPFSLLWFVEPLALLFRGRRVLEMLSKTVTVEEVKLL